MYKLIRGPTINPYVVFFEGVALGPTFLIGQDHVFTASSRSDKPDDACVDMYIRDWSRCSPGDTSERFVIDSYYDELSVNCGRSKVDHLLMFNVLKLFAFFADIHTIELLDGSRKITPKGCPWNLRIMNRLMKGEESKTFYQRFGFIACNDYLFIKKFRLVELIPLLKEESAQFIHEHAWETIEDVVNGMYALCNSDEYDGRFDLVQDDFIEAIQTYHKHRISKGMESIPFDIHKSSMAYVFHIHPKLRSKLRTNIEITPPNDGPGIIRITLDKKVSPMEKNRILNTSYREGGSKSRKKYKSLRRFSRKII